jgi:hypothetical protein
VLCGDEREEGEPERIAAPYDLAETLAPYVWILRCVDDVTFVRQLRCEVMICVFGPLVFGFDDVFRCAVEAVLADHCGAPLR